MTVYGQTNPGTLLIVLQWEGHQNYEWLSTGRQTQALHSLFYNEKGIKTTSDCLRADKPRHSAHCFTTRRASKLRMTVYGQTNPGTLLTVLQREGHQNYEWPSTGRQTQTLCSLFYNEKGIKTTNDRLRADKPRHATHCFTTRGASKLRVTVYGQTNPGTPLTVLQWEGHQNYEWPSMGRQTQAICSLFYNEKGIKTTSDRLWADKPRHSTHCFTMRRASKLRVTVYGQTNPGTLLTVLQWGGHQNYEWPSMGRQTQALHSLFYNEKGIKTTSDCLRADKPRHATHCFTMRRASKLRMTVYGQTNPGTSLTVLQWEGHQNYEWPSMGRQTQARYSLFYNEKGIKTTSDCLRADKPRHATHCFTTRRASKVRVTVYGQTNPGTLLTVLQREGHQNYELPSMGRQTQARYSLFYNEKGIKTTNDCLWADKPRHATHCFTMRRASKLRMTVYGQTNPGTPLTVLQWEGHQNYEWPSMGRQTQALHSLFYNEKGIKTTSDRLWADKPRHSTHCFTMRRASKLRMTVYGQTNPGTSLTVLQWEGHQNYEWPSMGRQTQALHSLFYNEKGIKTTNYRLWADKPRHSTHCFTMRRASKLRVTVYGQTNPGTLLTVLQWEGHQNYEWPSMGRQTQARYSLFYNEKGIKTTSECLWADKPRHDTHCFTTRRASKLRVNVYGQTNPGTILIVLQREGHQNYEWLSVGRQTQARYSLFYNEKGIKTTSDCLRADKPRHSTHCFTMRRASKLRVTVYGQTNPGTPLTVLQWEGHQNYEWLSTGRQTQALHSLFYNEKGIKTTSNRLWADKPRHSTHALFYNENVIKTTSDCLWADKPRHSTHCFTMRRASKLRMTVYGQTNPGTPLTVLQWEGHQNYEWPSMDRQTQAHYSLFYNEKGIKTTNDRLRADKPRHSAHCFTIRRRTMVGHKIIGIYFLRRTLSTDHSLSRNQWLYWPHIMLLIISPVRWEKYFTNYFPASNDLFTLPAYLALSWNDFSDPANASYHFFGHEDEDVMNKTRWQVYYEFCSFINRHY